MAHDHNQSASGCMGQMPHFLSFSTDSGDRQTDFEVVRYEELLNMFPEPKPAGRLDAGLLPNGKAYAPKSFSREQYLLFPSKLSYILYFTHHYFSRENLQSDSTFRSMLVNQRILPLERLIQAPRLKFVSATQEEVAQALVHSNILCIEDIGGGVRGVCRRDRFPSGESWASISTPVASSVYPTVLDGQFPVRISEVNSECVVDEQLHMKNQFPIDVIPSEHPLHGVHRTDAPVATANSACLPSDMLPMLTPTTTLQAISTTEAVPSNAANCPNLALPNTRATDSTMPGFQSEVTARSPDNFSSGPQQSLVFDPTSVVFNSSLCGMQNCNANLSASIHQVPEIPNVPVLPVRQPQTFGHYFINPSGHVSGGYPPAFIHGSPGGSPANYAVATALTSPQMASAPTFGGNLYTSHSSQFAPFGTHQPNAAFAAVCAAMTQQQQHAYIHTNLPSTVHPQTHPFPSAAAVQSAFPFYYTPQSVHLAHLQRPPTQRFHHGPVYPLQTYSYQTAALMDNSSQVTPETLGEFGKPDGVMTYQNAHQMTTTGVAYPLLLQTQIPFTSATHSSYNSISVDSRLVAATAGMHIQRPIPPARRGVNAFGLGSWPMVITTTCNSTAFGGNLALGAGAQCNTDPVETSTDHIDAKSTKNVKPADAGDSLLHTGTLVESDGIVTASSPSNGHKVDRTVETANVPDSQGDTPYDGVTKEKPTKVISADDSEDSASSGIGEMHSVCSSSTCDACAVSCKLVSLKPKAEGYPMNS
ncbi:uncharacterized protein DEA37_0007336 [Paragonimus westermani]|uniref:HTH La-type RNA-binding domain-containing protein n=1 Tax=Paragonimus westermani TaxID=34504 RepID=A0A5J4NK57_9TREM|nr:uncharacterized protein DEA37_0007336 [Paragonimus westermani]